MDKPIPVLRHITKPCGHFAHTLHRSPRTWRASLVGICGVLTMMLCRGAPAQTAFPTKPLRMIVASVPSGAMDAIARVVATKLGESLGQTVIVDNRGGANGAVAADITAKAPPDGHTLMLSGIGNLAVQPLLNKNVGYDPLKDLAPITLACLTGHIMVVHPTLPVKSVKEFIAVAKARPGELTYGTPGTGSTQHLSIALFQSMSKVRLLHVAYKGGAPATFDLVAGHTQFGFASTATSAAFVDQGRLRAIAVSTRQRSKLYPNLPTIAESGVPGYEVQNWYGLVVPAKVPQPVIARLNKEIVQILQLAESREPLLRLGIEVSTSTPETFGAYIKSEHNKWANVIREMRITE